MTTTVIHSFEVITLLLVIGKIFQIRKLYIQAAVDRAQTKLRDTRASSHPDTSKLHQTRTERPSAYAFNKLPEPEVSFSSVQDDVMLSKKIAHTKNIAASNNKAILNNYIDNFFPEPPPKTIQEPEQLPSFNYHVDSSAEDEFITVMEENAEMVRMLESSNRQVA